jgi:hypothetical protein
MCSLLCVALLVAPAEVSSLEVIVTETEGIRRFSYPVHVVLALGRKVEETDRFRLLENGKPVAAQFRPHGEAGKDATAVSLDFTISHGPLEKHMYTVEYGPSVEPGPEPKGETKVDLGKDVVKVSHGNALEWELPRDVLGLLSQVRAGKKEYLRPGSAGLFLCDKDDIHYRVGGLCADGTSTVARVARSGPLAAALRFEGNEALRGGRSVKSVVEMEFPRSKSWVRVDWTVDDPDGNVAGLGAELFLNIQGGPTLVDFGAGSLVYAPLRKGQTALMKTSALTPTADTPAWETLLGERDKLKPYVVAPRQKGAPPAEGWAHVMDRERCTAIAVADFASTGQESEITIDADGRLQIRRTFAHSGETVPRGPKRLTFWLHFVTMPVHVGAATSPQAMLSPPRIEVRPSRGE